MNGGGNCNKKKNVSCVEQHFREMMNIVDVGQQTYVPRRVFQPGQWVRSHARRELVQPVVAHPRRPGVVLWWYPLRRIVAVRPGSQPGEQWLRLEGDPTPVASLSVFEWTLTPVSLSAEALRLRERRAPTEWATQYE